MAAWRKTLQPLSATAICGVFFACAVGCTEMCIRDRHDSHPAATHHAKNIKLRQSPKKVRLLTGLQKLEFQFVLRNGGVTAFAGLAVSFIVGEKSGASQFLFSVFDTSPISRISGRYVGFRVAKVFSNFADWPAQRFEPSLAGGTHADVFG